MAITTIEAAGAQQCIARPNCSFTLAAPCSLIGGILLASLLARTGFLLTDPWLVLPFIGLELALFLFVLRIPERAGASCKFSRLENDRLIATALLRMPAPDSANRLAPPQRA